MSFYNVARNEAVPVIPGTMQSAGPRMRNNNLIGSNGIGLILTKVQPLCVSILLILSSIGKWSRTLACDDRLITQILPYELVK